MDFTVTYSDTNFDTSTLASGNITLNKTGTADAATITISGSGNTRTVTLSDISGSGTLGISIAAGTASDTAGNTAPAAGPSSTFIVCAGDAITVTDTGDSGPGSLRQAIADICPGGTIDFGVIGTIALTTGELVIGRDLTIAGPGGSSLTVSGNNASRMFNVSAGVTATIQDITVANGSTAGDGGGILNSGALTVTDSTISGNSGNFGGGIRNNGTLTVTNSTIWGNSGNFGGGIWNSGTLAVTNSTISGNSLSDPLLSKGGGIWNSGTLTVTNSTISDNSGILSGGATGGGTVDHVGGIYSSSGTVTITNSIIANGLSGSSCSGTVTDGGNNIDDGTTCASRPSFPEQYRPASRPCRTAGQRRAYADDSTFGRKPCDRRWR